MSDATPAAPAYTLRQLLLYMLRLGTTGFGGPVALVGYMFRDLVEQRKWISESDYKEGLTLAQLAPGPLAAQLAIYLGYVHYRIRGATLAGLCFIMPSFLMVLALGALYVRFGGSQWIQAAFYGVGASVIGIIAMSAYKLTTKNVGKDRLLWAIFLACAAITAVTGSEIVWVFIGGGLLVWLVRTPPKALSGSRAASVAVAVPVAASGFNAPLLLQVFSFFAKAGAIVFGSGLAIVPFLYGGVVTGHHWLTEQQFVDSVAVAMITPGPVVITAGFIGFLVAGVYGSIAAALGTFLPCYLFTVLLAPSFKKHGKRPPIVAFVDGATAAAIGTIAGSVIVLGRRSVVDLPTTLIMLATVVALWRFKKLTEPVVVLIAAVAGLVVYPLVHAAG